MSIYRRGRTWWIKITAPGHAAVRDSAGTHDRQAAQEYHDKRAAELWRTRRLGERPRVAFAAAATDWVTTHAKDKRSYDSDRLRMRVMLPLLPEYLDELTTTRMTTVRDRLKLERDIKPSSCNKYLAILSAILHHAHKREMIPAVPAVPMFPKGRRRKFTILSLEQAQALLDTLPRHLQAITRFALCTGLRDANVRMLKWEDVNLGERMAFVAGEDAKAGESIPVPLNQSAIEVLQGQLGEHPVYCFTYRGKPIGKRSNNSAWRRARAEIGLPKLQFHDTRRTWATWHKEAGTPDFELQAMGGWSDGRMVALYARMAAQRLLKHANAITVPGTTQGTVENSELRESAVLRGVADGIRTRNNRNHKAEVAAVIPIKSKTSRTVRRAKTGTK